MQRFAYLRHNRNTVLTLHRLQDNLAAHVRIETERRLKSLEADLAQAERARKERALAQRYHKVKFFGASHSDLYTSTVVFMVVSQNVRKSRES